MAPLQNASIVLRDDLFDDNKTALLRDAFRNNRSERIESDTKPNGPCFNVISHPEGFPLLSVLNIFDDDCAKRIKNALGSIKFIQKHNDLYRFQQSDALVNTKNAVLKNLSEFLASENMMNWVHAATGVELIAGKVDVAAQRYRRGDRLLCHDDDIVEDENAIVRRIAFILYFVDPSWTENDGGQLQTFGRDQWNQPKYEILSEVLPQWNSLALFEVTPTSYHQVAEVLSSSKTRLSITGWFYGPLRNDIREKWLPKHKAPLDMDLLVEPCDASLRDFITPVYLQPKALDQIQSVFCDQSQIELKQFFAKPTLKSLQKQLDWFVQQGIFSKAGPANCNHFNFLKTVPSSEDGSSNVFGFLRSTEFLNLIETMTCLKLSNPKISVRCFEGGSYTLVHDDYKSPPGLDVHLFLTTVHGNIIYLVDGEDDQDVVKSEREENKALLVLRDEGVTFFSEYLPKTLLRQGQKVFDILIQYEAEIEENEQEEQK